MSTNPKARAWIQVRADALRANYTAVAERVGPSAGVLPMVKADGYGLGIEGVVRALEPMDPWGYGVATVDEGVTLRELGVERAIVVCGPVPPDHTRDAVHHGLDVFVSSVEALDRLRAAAEEEAAVGRWHLEVDTGMGRSGFDWRSREQWLPVIADAGAALELVGITTHLHSADEDPDTIHLQWERLGTVTRQLARSKPGVAIHILNSAGSMHTPEYAHALVRPGIFLYGGSVGSNAPDPEPVVSLHARVAHVRDAPSGSTLGYGSTHTATLDQRWATLSIGYGDGLPRALGNRGAALIADHAVPIIGRISMDVTVVDITGVPDVACGCVATLVGQSGEQHIGIDDVASQAGTISYEVLTRMTPRLPRVWSGSEA